MKRNKLGLRIGYAIRENAAAYLIRLLAITAYIFGSIYVSKHSGDIAQAAENPLTSPNLAWAMTNIQAVFQTVGGAVVMFLLFYPFDRRWTENALRSIGMVNRTDDAPRLIRKKQDRDHPNVTVWHFRNNSIALRTWEDLRAEIETALGVIIVDTRYGKGNQRVLLFTVPAGTGLPDRIAWKDSYLSPKSFELVLGRSHIDYVTVKLAEIPHVLLGGATGSGKSILLKCLILQAVRKGAEVAIADFKGGVDFPLTWRKKCRMCFNEDALIELLDKYVAELQERKRIFGEAGIANLDEYNKAMGTKLRRCILACDEIAEVLDKTGLTKEQKELVARIESRLSLIARQGRAFGIHLILATQRPDANILSGQIRNNINCRICGRADSVLSQIILDSTAAADKIPKHAKGLFMLHDGTVFQGFLLDESTL